MIPKYVRKVMRMFDDAGINSCGELMLSYKHNVFIQLNDVSNKKDFGLKLLVWLSQYTTFFESISADVESKSFSGSVLKAIKYITGKEFSVSDYMLIHEVIGQGLNKELAQKFKEQDFDIKVLMEHRKDVENKWKWKN